MRKLLIALMSFLSLIFFSFGITNLLFYDEYYLCLNGNSMTNNWIFITGISYCVVGGLVLISMILELILDNQILKVIVFILGGSYVIGWTIYGSFLFFSSTFCSPIYQIFLGTLITFYIVIPFTIAALLTL